jgi:hypothetical protein
MRREMIVLVALILFFAGTGDLSAYTYIYSNRTGYPIKVTVQLYDDADKTGRIEADALYTISTRFLLKSWIAEVFLDNQWQQVLNLTCDFLPGNHTFTIYVNEVKGPDGKVNRDWYAINGGD